MFQHIIIFMQRHKKEFKNWNITESFAKNWYRKNYEKTYFRNKMRWNINSWNDVPNVLTSIAMGEDEDDFRRKLWRHVTRHSCLHNCNVAILSELMPVCSGRIYSKRQKQLKLLTATAENCVAQLRRSTRNAV